MLNKNPEMNVPDVLGMKMPAAVSLLEAAGISYHTVILKPVVKFPEEDTDAPMRVIRQSDGKNGSITLYLCAVSEHPQTQKGNRAEKNE